jgi:hypothetical protein
MRVAYLAQVRPVEHLYGLGSQVSDLLSTTLLAAHRCSISMQQLEASSACDPRREGFSYQLYV